MKLAAIFCATFLFGLLCTASAQTPAPKPDKSDDATQLEALAKKIDEQNAKIDALSQEILKLEAGRTDHSYPGCVACGFQFAIANRVKQGS